MVGVDGEDRVTSARAGYVSVSEVPVVVDLAEALFDGQSADGEPTPDALAAAGELALTRLDPGADIHATAHYRAHLVRVLTARVVTAAHRDAVERRARAS